jgi:hypothetical protein
MLCFPAKERISNLALFPLLICGITSRKAMFGMSILVWGYCFVRNYNTGTEILLIKVVSLCL